MSHAFGGIRLRRVTETIISPLSDGGGERDICPDEGAE